MTQAKKWPHNAEWVRLDCIALARNGRQCLLKQLDNINDPALLRQLVKAIEAFREIESKLLFIKEKSNHDEPTLKSL